MDNVRLVITSDTDNSSAVESIITILGELLPHMVDNVRIREDI